MICKRDFAEKRRLQAFLTIAQTIAHRRTRPLRFLALVPLQTSMNT
jgi:hypothetical protein